MPINRNALIRYKIIDRMLRDGRKAVFQVSQKPRPCLCDCHPAARCF